jgi:hypothetical protein
MSERIDIDDIQEFFRFTNVEDYLKNDNEKAAYKKYQDVYHELLNAEYKKREYTGLFRNISYTQHSQKTIDIVKSRVALDSALDKEIKQLEVKLEEMEQSKLFQKIHRRVLYGESKITNFCIKDKITSVLKKILQNKDLLKVVGYFLLLLWIDVIGNIVMDSYSGILTKIFFLVGIVILFFYLVFNHFIKDD